MADPASLAPLQYWPTQWVRLSIPILDLPLPAPPPPGSEWIAAYRHWASRR